MPHSVLWMVVRRSTNVRQNTGGEPQSDGDCRLSKGIVYSYEGLSVGQHVLDCRTVQASAVECKS